MKPILSIIFILLSIETFAQLTAPTIQWQKSLGGSKSDVATCIQQTTDGGYIVAGNSWSNDSDVSGNHGTIDYWIVKLKKNGAIQWQKSFGGNSYDQAKYIQQTTDGGYIVAGSSSSNDGDVTGNHGADDYWIIKLTKNGVIQWQKSLGGSGTDDATSIQQTRDSGYVVAGYSASNDGDVSGNHGSYDYWIVKLTKKGIIQWQKSLGGSGADFAYSVQQTFDGDYIIAGNSNSHDGNVTGYHGTDDYWIVKLSQTGTIMWQKDFGGSHHDFVESIRQTSDSGYIIAGHSNSYDGDVTVNLGSFDYWILKLDKTGNLQWQKSIGTNMFDDATCIQQTFDGGYIIGGYSSGHYNGHHTHGDYDYWIVKLAKNGNTQWQNFYGGSKQDEAYFIRQTTDSGYIVAGESLSNNGDVTANNGYDDYWIVKLNKDGANKFSPEAATINLQNNDAAQAKGGVKEFSVYPNPAKNVLHIQTNASAIVSLINSSGEILITKNINRSTDIDISKLPAGNYYLKNNTTGTIQQVSIER